MGRSRRAWRDVVRRQLPSARERPRRGRDDARGEAPLTSRAVLATLAAFLLLALAGCSHSPRPTANEPEPGHRDTRVASDPELERDRSRDTDDDDDQGEDRDDDRDAVRKRTSGGFEQRGIASYYATKFEGRRTASGEKYRGKEFTAAHRKLPFGTRVRVTNLDNGRSVEVVINDRGPHKKGRVIDLSRSAAKELGMMQKGLAQVLVEVLALAEE